MLYTDVSTDSCVTPASIHFLFDRKALILIGTIAIKKFAEGTIETKKTHLVDEAISSLSIRGIFGILSIS